MIDLHNKAEDGDLEAVIALIETGVDIDSVDSNGATALHNASYAGHIEVVKYLCSRGADVNLGNAKGYNPLIVASREGRNEVVLQLLANGADVNHSDDEGFTALIMGAGYSLDPQVLSTLIGAGANLYKATNTGGTALIWATWFGLVENVKLLIQAGADKEIAFDGKTPLEIAREKRFSEIEQLLS